MVGEFPLEVRIENTNLCNAMCTICPREQLTRPRGTMDYEFFCSIVDQLAQGGTKELHLQGYGEPFLDRDILRKISYAKKKGIPFTFMVTNASLLTEEVCKEIMESGLDKLKISFYGLNKTDYESIHRGLSFEEVRENVERLLMIKKSLGRRNPIISVKYIGSIGGFFKFFLQWGFKTRVSYARLHNYGYGRRFNRPRTDRKDRTCPIVTSSIMQVLWDGTVVPCCYDFDGKVVLGDLKKDSVRDVWNCENYQRFRGIHRRREYEKIPTCFSCDKLR